MTPPNPKVTAPERETDEQRKQFQNWARTSWLGSDFERKADGAYLWDDTEAAWIAWKEAQRLAREDERERCARIAERLADSRESEASDACFDIAVEIRDRSRQPGGAK